MKKKNGGFVPPGILCFHVWKWWVPVAETIQWTTNQTIWKLLECSQSTK